MQSELVAALAKWMRRPKGLITVCAPTGMGKTTAIYSALSSARVDGIDVMLNKDEVAEDPDSVRALTQAGIGLAPMADLSSARAGTIIAMGDVRHGQIATETVRLAETYLVVATIRIGTSSGAFTRLVDMGAEPASVANVSLASFGHRLIPGNTEMVPVHEELVVSNSIRDLVRARATCEEIERQAAKEGMRSLRQRALDQVASGRISLSTAVEFTPD